MSPWASSSSRATRTPRRARSSLPSLASAAVVCTLAAGANGLPNGAALLPPVGWNSWCAFGPCGTDICTEQQVDDTLTALEESGMIGLGYRTFTLDDCFAMRRASNGTLYPDPVRFPRGFWPLVQRAHSLGLEFGVYTSAGNYTCHARKANCSGECNVGSLGHYEEDAATFARWGLDFVKMDWCSASVRDLKCETQYGQMAAALNATGRRITFYMSCGGMARGQKWASDVSNVWRIGNDHLDCWDDGPCPRAVNYTSSGHGTKQAIGYLAGVSQFAGPGGWNTPDFLKTGGESCTASAVPGELCPKQTLVEYRTEYTMWAISSSPLLVSTDIRNLTAIQRAVLLNPEVIAIDQQPHAGDVVDRPACGAPPALAPEGWFVAHNQDALPELPHEQHGVFHEYGPTRNGSECQRACATNTSCTVYEWSAKSGNCWWRLDGKWVLRPTGLRESGCLVGRVAGCGQAPPPPPPPPPGKGDCQVWAKPLGETAYRFSRGWNDLASHHAVVLLNVGDSAAVVTANLTAIAPGATVVRDVWGNSTEAAPPSGTYSSVVPPHGSVLLRVWHE